MGVVAIAGGTGGLGRAIVDSLVAKGSNEVLVLSRKADSEREKELGARMVVADYGSIEGLVTLLEENHVDTVISTIDMMQGITNPDLNLIEAAQRSSVTKRFIPNMWGTKYDERIERIFPAGKAKMAIMRAVQNTNLEYTAVYIGFFLDYYVAPHVESYVSPSALYIDIPHNAAALPGGGDVPVGFSYTMDVAKFVAVLVDEDHWEKETFIMPDKVTMNEFVRIAEKARGAKFDVKYDSVEDLMLGKMSELPSYKDVFYPHIPKDKFGAMFSVYGILFESGALDLTPPRTMNDKYPEIKVHTVLELVEEAWKGR